MTHFDNGLTDDRHGAVHAGGALEVDRIGVVKPEKFSDRAGGLIYIVRIGADKVVAGGEACLLQCASVPPSRPAPGPTARVPAPDPELCRASLRGR